VMATALSVPAPLGGPHYQYPLDIGSLHRRLLRRKYQSRK
jgi:hypothetical protein